jgi:hypothetical protein
MQDMGYKRDTQQGNSYTKQAVKKRPPVTAKLGRVNEASHWNVWSKCWTNEMQSTAKRFFRMK